jgi:hypothetical protein
VSIGNVSMDVAVSNASKHVHLLMRF